MKKRSNENSQLRPEEVEALNNDDDETEELGTFKRASTEEIAARRIVKSKRSSDKVVVPSNAPSALSSFPAFSTTSSFAAPLNPFSNFTGLLQQPKSGAVPLSLPLTTTTAAATTTIAVPESSKQSEFNTKLKKLNSSFSQWVQRQMVEHPLSLWKDGLKDYIKYYDALVAKYGIDVTSESFIHDSPSDSESAPNSNSIAAAAKPISTGITPSLSLGQTIAPPKSVPISFNTDNSKSLGSNLFQSSNPNPATTTASSTFSTTTAAATTMEGSNKSSFFSVPAFGTTAPTTTAATIAAPPSIAPSSTAPAAGPLFSSSNAFGVPFPAPSGGNAPAAPALKFNFTGSNSFASSSSFGSGGSSSIFSAFPTSTTTTTAFGGVAAPKSTFGFAPQASQPTEDDGEGGDDAGEPILEPEKAIRDVNDTDEILHEAPCKLFRYDKDSKEWRDTGKGTFRITRSPDTRKQRMLVRNIIGKIIFNASFYKDMTLIVKEGKTSGIQFSAVVAEEETVKDDKGISSTRVKTEMKSFMLKFKPTDLATAAEKMRAGIASVSV